MKKLIIFLVLVTMLSSVVSVSAEETIIEVSAVATVIDVTVTPSATIAIDPNAGTVTTPVISIENHTPAPIIVTSGELQDDPVGYFNLVPSDTYADWAVLTKAQSADIAFTVSLDSNWKAITSGSLSTGVVGNLYGTIDPDTIATATITNVKNGNSFAEAVSSSFMIPWSLALE